jgi:mono/diheme cytochrome c family protein
MTMSDAPESSPSSPKLEQAGASDDQIQLVHAALRREKAEPSEAFAPLPLLLLFLFSVLIFLSAIYLERFSGGFDPLVYNENFKPGMGGPVGAVQIDPVVQGKRLFNSCITCHQATGQGLPGTYPPLAGSEWVEGSEEVLVRIVLQGLGSPVTVKGATFNGAMPAFGALGSNWRDDQIAWVLTYVRQEWGNKAPPITKETVTRIRTAAAGRMKAWTIDELKALEMAPAAPAAKP